MPSIALEVPETYNNITRPITVGMVRDLIKRFKLPNDTKVAFAGGAETIAHEGSTLASVNNDAIFPFHGKVNVEMEEMYIEDNILTTAIKRFDNPAIFEDAALGVKMHPVYTSAETAITFTYSGNSQGEVERWRDNVRRKSTEGMETLLHELIYHFSPPTVFHPILREIYNKRESLAGYNETWEKWLEDCYDPRMSVLSNLDGERGLPIISEKQIQVQGWFDFRTEPDKGTKEEDGAKWTFSFTYTFQWDKVTGMVLRYPITVHNQLLNMKYIPVEKIYNPYDQPRRTSHSGALRDDFSKINYERDTAYTGVVIPEFDDWRGSEVSSKTFPIFTALTGIDAVNPLNLLNLRELGEVSIAEPIMMYIRDNRKWIMDYLSSVFLITVYKGDIPQSSANFYLDENLDINSNSPLDLRKVYHVRLSFVTDLRLLRPFARDVLLNNPDICYKVIDLVESLQTTSLGISDRVGAATPATYYGRSRKGTGRFEGKLTDTLRVIGDRLVTNTSFTDTVSKIKTGIDLAEVGQGRGINSVMAAGIIIHKG